jgi:hypothetical protein
MSGAHDEAALRDAVQQACLELDLPLAYRSVVRQMFQAPRAEWPACCDTGCFPCTKTLGDAALRARELLTRSAASGET